ncbi:Ubiquitin conjugating-3 enzyme [Aphelenchoides fujianensis]|nr:Ubiquitin conjugating-3 enzyme [Aphelenchoides fujianensis]
MAPPPKSERTDFTKKHLLRELAELTGKDSEGFRVQYDERDLFQWTVAIFGPPGTIYAGGYFKAQIDFPADYPFAPPSFRFTSKLLHPNVYKNGKLCISILHPAGEDATSGESAVERWNPTQTVRTILLSVISLLNEPNLSSPANVDAAALYKKWQEGGDEEYVQTIKKQIADSKLEAERDGVKVPETVEEYVVPTAPPPSPDYDAIEAMEAALYGEPMYDEFSGEFL